MKNINLTQLDPNQLTSREHDVEYDAKRVIVVHQDLSGLERGLSQAVERSLSNVKLELPSPNIIERSVFIPQIEYKTIEVPVIVTQIEYKEIEKPIYIKEYEKIEVPVIVKEIQYKEIEKQVMVPQIEYRTIEVPVIVKEYEKQKQEVPMWVKVLLSGHGLTLLGLLISHFIK